MTIRDTEPQNGFLEGHSTTVDKDLGSWKSNEDLTDVQRFYSGASVLVTGATGFMGKVLIEKLLRSCPDIDTVFMMVREKKGRSLDERIDDLVSSPCFDRIKKEQPDFRRKIRAVAGDIGAAGLGMREQDRNLLQQQVNIVFHVAATVRFDEHMKVAILVNVRGTRELLSLCRTFRNLRSVVHVSTAYSNCPDMQIDERFYEPPVSSDHAIHLAETTDVTTLDHLSHKLLGKWPNTYNFTKALAEDVVRTCGQGLRVGIMRPSIVVTTANEPMKGWIDNMYGPAGFIAGAAAGVLRTMHVRLDCEANIVPCDMVVNALIAMARDVAGNSPAPQDAPVFNYVSTKNNPITWDRYLALQTEMGFEFPCSRAIWLSKIFVVQTHFTDKLMRLLTHILPAILVDTFLLATNRAPRMLRIYPKIHKFQDLMIYFTTKEWDFENKKVPALWNELSQEDKKLFAFDMDSVNWPDFIYETWPGTRTHLLDDPMDTIPLAKARWRRLTVLHYSLLMLLSSGAVWAASRVLPLLCTALASLTDLAASYGRRMATNMLTPLLNDQPSPAHFRIWDTPTPI